MIETRNAVDNLRFPGTIRTVMLMLENTYIARPDVDPFVVTLRSVAHAHISAEIVERRALADVHKAIKDADRAGVEIDTISEATGLRPEIVKDILDSDGGLKDLDLLLGVE